jgi:hypothetical protein
MDFICPIRFVVWLRSHKSGLSRASVWTIGRTPSFEWTKAWRWRQFRVGSWVRVTKWIRKSLNWAIWWVRKLIILLTSIIEWRRAAIAREENGKYEQLFGFWRILWKLNGFQANTHIYFYYLPNHHNHKE